MPQNQPLENASQCVTTANPVHCRINAVNSNENKIQLKTTQIVLENTKTTTVVLKQTLTRTTVLPMLPTLTTQTNELTQNHELSTHSVRPIAKPTAPQRKTFLEPIEQINLPLGIEDDGTESKPTAGHTEGDECNCPVCGPNFKLDTPRLHSGSSINLLETTTTKLPSTPEVVWQQPPETFITHQKLILLILLWLN